KSIQSRHTFFPSIPSPQTEYEMDLVYEDQDFMIDGDSSREAFFYNTIEGEDECEETDESYQSLNFDTTVNDPVFASFINELFQDSSDHINFQKFYYFNTCYYE
ncbi:28906_t:CDS:1, partial [Racocetra persica]